MFVQEFLFHDGKRRSGLLPWLVDYENSHLHDGHLVWLIYVPDPAVYPSFWETMCRRISIRRYTRNTENQMMSLHLLELSNLKPPSRLPEPISVRHEFQTISSTHHNGNVNSSNTYFIQSDIRRLPHASFQGRVD